MGFATDEKNVEETLPLTVDALAAGNQAIIEEDCVTAIEQKKLGQAKTSVYFSDMSHCDIIPGDDGDTVRIKKHVGNQLNIGPLDPDVAARIHALITKLWRGE